MSTETQMPERDLAGPATSGELLLAKTELGRPIDKVSSDLNGRMDRVRLEMKQVQLGVYRMIWIAVATMGAIGMLFRLF